MALSLQVFPVSLGDVACGHTALDAMDIHEQAHVFHSSVGVGYLRPDIPRRAVTAASRRFTIAASIHLHRTDPDRLGVFSGAADCACLIHSACCCRSLAMSWPIWGCEGNMSLSLSSLEREANVSTSPQVAIGAAT